MHGGVCYTKEMQEQAAPPRFRGLYPHKLKIPSKYIPRDRFVREALYTTISRGSPAEPISYIDSMGIEHHQYLQRVGDVFKGHFPRMILSIKDPEILQLAGGAPDFPTFDAIDCKDITCTCSDKPRYEQLFSDTTLNHDAIVYNNCKRTIFAAAKRQMKAAPAPSREVAYDFVEWSKRKLRALIGDVLDNFGYSFNQWFNHLTYAKQQRMLKVQDFLNGVGDKYYSGVENLTDELHYEAICKVEVQGIDGKPRMVCAIPDLVKYVMGPVCWRLEEVFQDRIPTYCGGKNLDQMQDHINHLIDEGFCVVAEGDGSAFDNTQDVLLKGVDRFVYESIADSIYHVPKELFLLVANQFYKVMDVIATINGKRETLMTYAILGTVFSGDCDTTLMNTLRMGFYNWYTNERSGLNIHWDFECFSKGDDFTVMYHIRLGEFSIKDKYRKYWLAKHKPDGPSYEGCDERIHGLGQILKFIELGEPNSIKFCSLRAWYTGPGTQHIYLTRDPSKFYTLAKYSRKACHMTNAELAKYCNDQADALLKSYAGVHYFETMAQQYQAVAQYLGNFVSDDKRKPGRTARDRRQTLVIEAEQQFDGYYRWPRHMTYQIQGNYWDTMQSIERAHNTTLTPDQLWYVNMQIDAEYLDRDLRHLSAMRPY